MKSLFVLMLVIPLHSTFASDDATTGSYLKINDDKAASCRVYVEKVLNGLMAIEKQTPVSFSSVVVRSSPNSGDVLRRVTAFFKNEDDSSVEGAMIFDIETYDFSESGSDDEGCYMNYFFRNFAG